MNSVDTRMFKSTIRVFCTLLVSTFFALSMPLSAQHQSTRPRVGLALSGGGAKGFAHIGVLEVLEEIGIDVDCIAGTSMGSIIGGLYAIGYSSQQLADIVTRLSWEELLTDNAGRRYLSMLEKRWDGRFMGYLYIHKGSIQLPTGLVSGQKITNLLSQLSWSVHYIDDFTELPIPFVCVATNIETGAAVPITHGYLPEALRASMAIPTVFTPVVLDNQLLVDGGLVRNLPAEDVRALGADIVIGVDVGAPLRDATRLNSLLAIIDQSVSLQAAASTAKQRALCDVLIVPEFGELGFSDFAQVKKLIAVGEEAARRMQPQLQALADSLHALENGRLSVKTIPPKVDSIYVTSLEIEGLQKVSHRLVNAELNINYPSWISAAALERAIARVYGTQYFERITYQLEPEGASMKLIVKVIEKDDDLFQFALRYDSRQKASLLFNLMFKNLTGHGTTLSMETIVGGKTRLDAEYLWHTGLRPGIGLRVNTTYSSSPIDIYRDGAREARLRARSFKANVNAGTWFSPSVTYGAGFQREIISILPDIAPQQYKSSEDHVAMLYGLLWIDSTDRAVFPTSGQILRLQANFARRELGSPVVFEHYSLDWQSYFRANRRLSILGRLQLGRANGANLPLPYYFFLGGVESFLGLRAQEKMGRALQVLQLGLQYETPQRHFVIARWNIGNTFEHWHNNIPQQHYLYGIGLTLGTSTPLGPLELTVMGGSRHGPLFDFNFGYHF